MPVSLTVEKRVEGDCLVLKATGNVVEHECSTLLGAIRQGLRPGIARVILDMGGVAHMSSAAVTELATERHRLAAAGCQLVLACANGKLRKLISLGLLDKAATTVDSVEKALAGKGSPKSGDSQRILGPDGLVG